MGTQVLWGIRTISKMEAETVFSSLDFLVLLLFLAASSVYLRKSRYRWFFEACKHGDMETVTKQLNQRNFIQKLRGETMSIGLMWACR